MQGGPSEMNDPLNPGNFADNSIFN